MRYDQKEKKAITFTYCRVYIIIIPFTNSLPFPNTHSGKTFFFSSSLFFFIHFSSVVAFISIFFFFKSSIESLFCFFYFSYLFPLSPLPSSSFSKIMLRVIVVIINSFRFVCFLVLLMVLIYKLLIIINFFFSWFCFLPLFVLSLAFFLFSFRVHTIKCHLHFLHFLCFFLFSFFIVNKEKQKMSNNNTHKKKEK